MLETKPVTTFTSRQRRRRIKLELAMRILLLAVEALLAVSSVSGFVPAPFNVQPSQHRPTGLFATATEVITGTVKW